MFGSLPVRSPDRWCRRRGRHPFKTNEAAHVVDEVRHSDFAPRANDADGAHELSSHAVLLITKYMLDAGANSKSHRGSWVHGQFGNVTEDQDFRFQPPPRLEAVAQHADEKEGNCNHTTIML